MIGYLVKVTCLEGEFEGQSYYRGKGGRKVKLDAPHSYREAYGTLAMAEANCRKIKLYSDADYKAERLYEEKRIKEGGKPLSFYAHHLCSYEPVLVEITKGGN